MKKHLGKNYYIDTEKKILYRLGLKESKHLMWKYGGIPFFNAKIVDEWKDKITHIGAKTDKHKFVVPIKIFWEDLKEHNNKGEIQISCDKFFWEITNLE